MVKRLEKAGKLSKETVFIDGTKLEASATKYNLQPESGIVFTCMTSDFFLEEADEWRSECWRIRPERS